MRTERKNTTARLTNTFISVKRSQDLFSFVHLKFTFTSKNLHAYIVDFRYRQETMLTMDEEKIEVTDEEPIEQLPEETVPEEPSGEVPFPEDKPPHGRPPHGRPPHGEPPHEKPPHGRPPHGPRPPIGPKPEGEFPPQDGQLPETEVPFPCHVPGTRIPV